MKYVLKKELTRVFSDKKLVFSIFILPALIMIVVYSIMGNAMKSMMDDIEQRASRVYIVNAPQDFKDIIDVIQTQNTEAEATSEELTESQGESMSFGLDADYGEADIENEEALSDYKNKVLEGELDLIICFPKDFKEKIDGYSGGDGETGIPEIKTYYNPSEDYSSEARQRFGNILEQYRQVLLSERVTDINELIVFSVDLNSESSIVEKEGAGAAKMLSMILPYLIVFLLFTGPMSLGIDAITGEKERGTMASMLVTPVKRSDIVTGKMIAVSILSLLSSLIYAGSMLIAIPMSYQGAVEELDLNISFNLFQVVEVILIMLALVYLYVNLVSLVAVLAKNAKEAQSLVMPIYILVLIAGVFTVFGGNTEPEFFKFAIPVYGSAIGIQQLIMGNLQLSELLLNMGVTLIMSAVLSFAISKAFESERLMFNA